MSQYKSTTGHEKSGPQNFLRQTLYLSAGALTVSVMAHFILDYNWLKIVTNHIGGLGIAGLFACLSGFLAGRKGYDLQKTFYAALFIPVVLGIITVIIISIKFGFTYCGGGIILLASGIFAIVSLFLKRKTN